MQETQVQSLAWEELMEKEMATLSQYSCLEKSIARGTRGGYRPWGRKVWDMTEQLILPLWVVIA